MSIQTLVGSSGPCRAGANRTPQQLSMRDTKAYGRECSPWHRPLHPHLPPGDSLADSPRATKLVSILPSKYLLNFCSPLHSLPLS